MQAHEEVRYLRNAIAAGRITSLPPTPMKAAAESVTDGPSVKLLAHPGLRLTDGRKAELLFQFSADLYVWEAFLRRYGQLKGAMRTPGINQIPQPVKRRRHWGGRPVGLLQKQQIAFRRSKLAGHPAIRIDDGTA